MTRINLDQPATSREQILFAVVALVLLILFFRVFAGDQARRIDLLKGRSGALSLEKDALIKFSSFTPTLQKGAALSQKKGIKLRILTGELKPIASDISSLLRELTKPEFLGSVTIENLSYLPMTSDQGYLKTDFRLNAHGSFVDVLKYLERLEQFPALFNVHNLSLTAVEAQSQDVQAEIFGRFYQLKIANGGTS